MIMHSTFCVANIFYVSLNKYRYLIKVYFMIVLDINKYAVTKLAIRIMLLKYPSAGNCWHLALHVLYFVCLHC